MKAGTIVTYLALVRVCLALGLWLLLRRSIICIPPWPSCACQRTYSTNSRLYTNSRLLTTPRSLHFIDTMGFIKRLLSMGSKKGKKSKRTQLAGTPYEATAHAATSEDVSFRKRQQDDEEANANRLLRSSSAHFTVVSEVDYASLPPIRM